MNSAFATDPKAKAAIDKTLASRFTDHKTYLAAAGDRSFVIERADLLYVWDQYRNQYLDFSAQTMPVGHNNPAVHAAISEALHHYQRVGAQGDYLPRWPVQYAQMLSESLPKDSDPPQRVLYAPDAAAAFTMANTLAQRFTDRVYLHLNPRPHTDPLFSDAAALIWDLVDDDGSPLDPYHVQTTTDAAIQAGALVIVDESRTGFGRIGTFWGQERWQIDADITVVGSPGGGGFQFGAVIARPEIFLAAADHDFKRTAYSGDPIICAAGAATMSQISLGLLEHVSDAGHTLHDALKELQLQFPDVLKSSRGAGLYQTLECQTEALAREIRHRSLLNGLLLPRPRGALITLNPPLIISENEVRRGVDLLSAACLDRE